MLDTKISPDGNENLILGRGAFDCGICVTFGVFDGVHVGHDAVIKAFIREARTRGLHPTLIKIEFESDAPFTREKLLTPGAESIELLRRYAPIDIVVARLSGDDALMSPENFLREYILHGRNVKAVVAGENCRFSFNADGGTHTIKKLARTHGYAPVIIDAVEPAISADLTRGAQSSINADLLRDATPLVNVDLVYGAMPPVSADLIRGALSAGDAQAAGRMLGRRYTLRGEVVRGNRLGRGVGMPTANVFVPADKFLPAYGVYATVAKLDGAEYASLTHIGVKPTVDPSSAPTIETHILDFYGDIYSKTLTVELIAYIRETRKFDSLAEVKKQVDADIKRARGYFANL